jgi:hypothetical protein
MRRSVALSALLLTVLFAGCSGSPGGGAAEPEPDAFDDVEVTETTGAIRGIVVSEAIVPIADVLVALTDGRNQTTDAEGAFVFNGLEPGDYFVSASKAGYLSQQQSATVVAGGEPPITKILLPADIGAQPFSELYQWTGFLQCGANLIVRSANPCAFTGSDNVHVFEWSANGRIPDFAQAEAIWTGTQPAGNWLAMNFHDPNGATGTESCYTVNSESPAILNVTMEEIVACEGEEAEKLTVRLFPGASDGTPSQPTVLANQQYDVYIQYFFGFVPRAGYTLAADGLCDVPAKCT